MYDAIFGLNSRIPVIDATAEYRSRSRWDAIAKPLGSLGLLEKAVIKISALTASADYTIKKRAVMVMCADNGVVAQNVTQTGSEVTAIVARNMTTGDASVCRMAQVAKADVVPVDMGMLQDLQLPQLLSRRIAAGTQDISCAPAMTPQQAISAVEVGIELVKKMKADGYRILLLGEMGIGNTTTSSAMASALLGVDPQKVTGRGAGLSGEGVKHKTDIVRKAIEHNCPDAGNAMDVLAKLGGFDIAGLVGIIIGGAMYRVPILLDGLISGVAALCAVRICPNAINALIASHISAEPAGKMLLDALGLEPIICAGMYLGEGSGAVAALPLLDMAYAVYGEMRTFGEINIESYVPLD